MRKKPHEDHINHEAWAIPYADLMTLLLAFFVVMYAVSVVNEGKYRVASESLNEAFNGSSRPIVPLSASNAASAALEPSISVPGASGRALSPINVPLPQRRSPTKPAARSATSDTDLARMEDQVRKALLPLIERKLVMIRHGPDWLEIEIRTDILFPSGVAQLSLPADAVLRSLAGILAPFDNPLRVEGFTDNVPIASNLYPSNWELSAARAASVARLFSAHGVRQDRLGIVGWGEVRPVAANSTLEGRNQNRRVLVVVMSERTPSHRATESVQDIVEPTQLAEGSDTAMPAALEVAAGTMSSARGAPAMLARVAKAPVQTTATSAVSTPEEVMMSAAPSPVTSGARMRKAGAAAAGGMPAIPPVAPAQITRAAPNGAP